MNFKHQLIPGKLLRRYKRFLADVELENGEIVTVHCTNTGSMKSCLEEGAPVYLSSASDPKRKTKYTWEMIFINEAWIGINTIVPNVLVYEAMAGQNIRKLSGYQHVKREVKYQDSRFDLYAKNENEECFIEVKNVTMKEADFVRFPDSITTRGRKHLETLMEAKTNGYRAVLIFVIQRTDVKWFGPAWDIDPIYSGKLVEASNHGVEIIPLLAEVSPLGINLTHEIPLILHRDI